MDTLTRMRAFLAVVDHEGFSAAARALGRSKALLSKYVRELEDELGTRLLNRTTRQFSLTNAGHTYYKRAIDLIREFDDLQDQIRDSGTELSGRLKISAPRTLADSAIGQSLVAFAEQNPDIELEIHLDDRFVDLVEEAFDLAIRITKLEDSSLIARKLAPFRLKLVASPDFLATHGTPQTAEDLTKLPFIIDSNARRRNGLNFLDEQGQARTVPVSGRMIVNSPMVVRNSVLAGLGFAVAPDFIVKDDIADGRLIEILPDQLEGGSGIYAVYPHRRYLPSKVRALVDFMAEWFKQNSEQGE